MLSILVYGGTTKSPKGAGLCETCRNAHIVRGESGLITYARCCLMQSAPVEIKRPVSQCSDYVSRASLLESELEKVAWIFKDDGHGHLKFVPPG